MDSRSREIALFAGAGGGCLASKWLLGWRTVAYVEINSYRQRVLQPRITDGLVDDAPIWDDIRSFDGRPWRGCVDILSAGFPCTPWSVAGQHKGADDERNLWPDTLRIIREVGRDIAFLENVPPLIRRPYFRDEILGGLAESGYDAVWGVFSAAQVGAPHLRQRLLVLAYARSEYRRIQSVRGAECPYQTIVEDDGKDGIPADADHEGWDLRGRGEGDIFSEDWLAPSASQDRQDRRPSLSQGDKLVAHPNGPSGGYGNHGVCQAFGAGTQGGEAGSAVCSCGATASDVNREQMGRPTEPRQGSGYWATEPDVGRVASGVASRVDRLSALGDGQVPLTVAYAYAVLSKKAFGHA